eukprot:COSAG06_NODE_177_length_21031_cov_13.839528_7_plen_95_part_00
MVRERCTGGGRELLQLRGRRDESFSGKEADRVITLSGFSLAILYYHIINDRTQLEPRRIINQVKVSSTPTDWDRDWQPVVASDPFAELKGLLGE